MRYVKLYNKNTGEYYGVGCGDSDSVAISNALKSASFTHNKGIGVLQALANCRVISEEQYCFIKDNPNEYHAEIIPAKSTETNVRPYHILYELRSKNIIAVAPANDLVEDNGKKIWPAGNVFDVAIKNTTKSFEYLAKNCGVQEVSKNTYTEVVAALSHGTIPKFNENTPPFLIDFVEPDQKYFIVYSAINKKILSASIGVPIIKNHGKEWHSQAAWDIASVSTGVPVDVLSKTCNCRCVPGDLYMKIKEIMNKRDAYVTEFDLDPAKPTPLEPELKEYTIRTYAYTETGRYYITDTNLDQKQYKLISSSPVRAKSLEDAVKEISARYIFVDGKPVEPGALFWQIQDKMIVKVESVDYTKNEFTCLHDYGKHVARVTYSITTKSLSTFSEVPPFQPNRGATKKTKKSSAFLKVSKIPDDKRTFGQKLRHYRGILQLNKTAMARFISKHLSPDTYTTWEDDLHQSPKYVQEFVLNRLTQNEVSPQAKRIVTHLKEPDYKAMIEEILTEVSGSRWNVPYNQLTHEKFCEFIEDNSKNKLFFAGVKDGKDLLAQKILKIIQGESNE